MNAKKAEKKEIQRNKERTVDESLFKPKEAERKQKKLKKRKYKINLKTNGSRKN